MTSNEKSLQHKPKPLLSPPEVGVPFMECMDCHEFLEQLTENSVDLVLTDPPYTISKDTGFGSVKDGEKRFSVSMDFGDWDKDLIDLRKLAIGMHRCLREGGTAIVWYDLWKITPLEQAMNHAGFKMSRIIIWQKTNPVPINQRATYLSNSREVAIVSVKGGKPTFKGKYENGNYFLPIPRHNGNRIHPTQKPLNLFQDLIEKHSNEHDLVIDPFLGSGTTAVACQETGRRFMGCDIDPQYIKKARRRIATHASDLFLELACPDEQGISREVYVTEFRGKYTQLKLGNGGSWCRDDGMLGRRYKIVRHKDGGAIDYIKLNGFNTVSTKKPVPKRIKDGMKGRCCDVLAISKFEITHKNGRYTDYQLTDQKNVTMDDFQALSKAANNAKKQHCKECKVSNKRFDAKRLGYAVSQFKGDEKYRGSCIGCYWHDPKTFNHVVSNQPRNTLSY